MMGGAVKVRHRRKRIAGTGQRRQRRRGPLCHPPYQYPGPALSDDAGPQPSIRKHGAEQYCPLPALLVRYLRRRRMRILSFELMILLVLLCKSRISDVTKVFPSKVTSMSPFRPSGWHAVYSQWREGMRNVTRSLP